MPGWANLTLVTDSELGQIEPQATSNQSPSPWGATTWTSARAEAKRELKVLIETTFPKVPGVADRILDRHKPDWVFSLISAAYADVTTAAVDDEEEDLALGTIFASASNRLYIGADYQFEGLWIKLLNDVNTVARTLTVKYSGSGTAVFTTVSATDGTSSAGKTFAQAGRVTWTIPSDWQRIRLNGTAAEYFWIELSVDGAITATTAASQVLPIRAPDGLKRVAAYLSLFYILNGLERQAGRPEEWKEKAAWYRTEALKLFDVLKNNGGIPLDMNRDEVVTQAEIQQTAPLRLGRA
jgi:hypothetical protein